MIDLVVLLHPPLQCGITTDLLNMLEANPMFTTGDPFPEFLKYLEHIETADPQAFDRTDNKHNLGLNWEHYQCIVGSLTCTSVIKSWTSICHTLVPLPSCYLSDDYLAQFTEVLWAY